MKFASNDEEISEGKSSTSSERPLECKVVQ
jgi:hypothetical protein